jgi:hypothetical protein
MEQKTETLTPGRVTDLVGLKQKGLDIVCRVSFEILPVDFQHHNNPFKAYIFLAKYNGTVDGRAFSFRKCYARGCPHNLCPHVSQAVMIANRHLARDYQRLAQAGLDIEQKLFTLEEMLLKFNGYREEQGPVLSIHDFINLANEGTGIKVDTALEFVPAVEHFANQKNKMIFLMADFVIDYLGKTTHYERCLACYEQEKENEQKQEKMEIANSRLKLLYDEFEQASMEYNKNFFV